MHDVGSEFQPDQKEADVNDLGSDPEPPVLVPVYFAGRVYPQWRIVDDVQGSKSALNYRETRWHEGIYCHRGVVEVSRPST